MLRETFKDCRKVPHGASQWETDAFRSISVQFALWQKDHFPMYPLSGKQIMVLRHLMSQLAARTAQHVKDNANR